MSKAAEFRAKTGQLTKEVQISDRLGVTLCKFDKLSMAMHGDELPLTFLRGLQQPAEERARYFRHNPKELFVGLAIILRWGVFDPRFVITDVEGQYGKRPDGLAENEIAYNELTDQEQTGLINAIMEFNSVGNIEQVQQEASEFFRIDGAQPPVECSDAASDGEELRRVAHDDYEAGHA